MITRLQARHYRPLALTMILMVVAGCATPGLMKRWERQDHLPIESENFKVYLDDEIPRNVGKEVLDSLEFGRDRVGKALGYYSEEQVVCNLYRNEQNLRRICVGLPLGFFVPRRTPLAYVLGGEVHGRLFTTPSGNVARLWVSTFPHEYCHVMFKDVTGRQYYQYSWLQEGLGEYFRRLYLQEKVVPPNVGDLSESVLMANSAVPNKITDPDLYLQSSTNGVWSYTDWEVRDALRFDDLPSSKDLCPKTFIGYWKKFNTAKANQIYAISSSLVEYLVSEHGWKKMQGLLQGLGEDSSLDRVMLSVYGFDQEGLDERWRAHLAQKWPSPWQPNIAMLYLVRGNWEIDGLESGIRTALAERDMDAARRHRMYLESRRIFMPEPQLILPVSHSGRAGDDPRFDDPISGDPLFSDDFVETFPLYRDAKAPAIEHYEAAMAAYSMGQFSEGVVHLSAAIELEPEQIRYLRVHLARGLWLTGRHEQAVAHYADEVLETNDVPFLNEVAWCYEQAGKSREAVNLYQTIAESTDIKGLRAHAEERIRIIEQGGTPQEPAEENLLSLTPPSPRG